jgi:hypothetical protein
MMLLLSGLARILEAQGGTASAALTIETMDSSGLPLPGAKLALKNPSTGATRLATANEAGRATLVGLAAGDYLLEASLEGFQIARMAVSLSTGQTRLQSLRLNPGAVSTAMEVDGHSELIETSAANASVSLGGDRIEEAPAANRNYLGFVLTAPAIGSSPGANTMRSATGIRNPANDTGFTFAGMRGRNNGMTIDGADNRDETTGGGRVAIGLEMVQEFRVSGTSVSAEYGGAAGAQVNVVTRSGENLWHGDFTMFAQNEKLSARNPEARTASRPLHRRYQPGVSLGGPIQRDRTFFYSAIEWPIEDAEEWSESAPGLRGLRPGLFATSERGAEGSFKVSHTFRNYHQLSARYADSRGRVRGGAQAGDNFADVSAYGSSATFDHSLVGGWTAVLGPSRTNDLRGQWSRRDASMTPNETSGPMIAIPGVLTFGRNEQLDQSRVEDHQEIVDNLQLVRSGHLIGIGASVHRVAFDGVSRQRFGGVRIYPSIDAFDAGMASLTLQAVGDPALRMSTTPAGFWIQDRWQPRRGLTFDIGLRYDRQWLPRGVPMTSRNIAPRLGIAWHPRGESKWVLRAGAGIFYDRYPLAFVNQGLLKDGVRGWEVYNGQVKTYRFAPGFRAAASFKASGGVERRIDENTVLTAEYTYLKGMHLPGIRGLGNAFELGSSLNSRYNGLTVAVNRRLRKELAYLVSYSIGWARDQASDFDEHPNDPADLRAEWGRSRLDQRHRFAASVLYELPLEGIWENITLAPVVRQGSARPLNILTPEGGNGAYPLSARPAGVARNTAEFPGEASFDLRLMKTIAYRENRSRLQFGAESFNLLNHTNYLRASAFQGPRFGGLVEASNPRQIQLFMQFEY